VRGQDEFVEAFRGSEGGRLMPRRSEMPNWNQHPKVLRALAQSLEVQYYLPPGEKAYSQKPPLLARAIPAAVLGSVLAL